LKIKFANQHQKLDSPTDSTLSQNQTQFSHEKTLDNLSTNADKQISTKQINGEHKPKKRKTEIETLLIDGPKNSSLILFPTIDEYSILPVFWDDGARRGVPSPRTEIIDRKQESLPIFIPNFRELPEDTIIDSSDSEDEEDFSDEFYERLHAPLEYEEHENYLKMTQMYL